MLYDAIAVIASTEGAALLAREATAKDFVSDAFAHAKFIAYSEAAETLFEKAGVTEMDGGFVRSEAAGGREALFRCLPQASLLGARGEGPRRLTGGRAGGPCPQLGF